MKSKIVSRKKDIDVLFEIIENREFYKENSENGLVILLNGSWGSGKTTFINELEKEIANNQDLDLFTNYNSFEYDFYENAYLPLFANIEDKIKLGKKNFDKLIKGTGMMFFNTAYAITNGYLKTKTGVDLNEIRDNYFLYQEEPYIKVFNDFVECKKKVKEKLSKFCKDKPKIFIVDELDRCKPTFAMETLEIIKHFFDIENCIFIICVDRLQIQESAKTIYGQNMDIEKYFSKFYDYQYNLLPLNFNEIIDSCKIDGLKEVIDRSTNVFNSLKVSSRDSKKIFSDFICKYNKYCNMKNPWTGDQCLFVLFLLTLKYVDLLFFKEIMDGNYLYFKQKITDERNPSSNNYNRLLAINIGCNKDFDYVLSKFSSEFDTRFIEKSRLKEIIINESPEMKHAKSVTIFLNTYIPYIGDNFTFKETIYKIIN